MGLEARCLVSDTTKPDMPLLKDTSQFGRAAKYLLLLQMYAFMCHFPLTVLHEFFWHTISSTQPILNALQNPSNVHYKSALYSSDMQQCSSLGRYSTMNILSLSLS